MEKINISEVNSNIVDETKKISVNVNINLYKKWNISVYKKWNISDTYI